MWVYWCWCLRELETYAVFRRSCAQVRNVFQQRSRWTKVRFFNSPGSFAGVVFHFAGMIHSDLQLQAHKQFDCSHEWVYRLLHDLMSLSCLLSRKILSGAIADLKIQQHGIWCAGITPEARQWGVMCMQGHFQIFFKPAVCPLFQHQLSLGMRIMYTSGIWSYVVCSICTPFFLVRQ